MLRLVTVAYSARYNTDSGSLSWLWKGGCARHIISICSQASSGLCFPACLTHARAGAGVWSRGLEQGAGGRAVRGGGLWSLSVVATPTLRSSTGHECLIRVGSVNTERPPGWQIRYASLFPWGGGEGVAWCGLALPVSTAHRHVSAAGPGPRPALVQPHTGAAGSHASLPGETCPLWLGRWRVC